MRGRGQPSVVEAFRIKKTCVKDTATEKEKAKLEARLKVLEERDAVGQKRLEMVENALTQICCILT